MSERAPQIDRDRAVRLQWASDALDVPVAATAAKVRTAFLQSLVEDDFVPPASRHEALLLLEHEQWHDRNAPAAESAEREPVVAQAAPETPWACQAAVEEGLLAEVEEFATRMFQISQSERREQWRALEARAREHLRVQARLEALVTGLSVDLARLDPSATALLALAHRLCQLFVLRPLPRAALRERMLEEWAEEPSKWQIAARLLASRHADVAALDWPLVTHLEKPSAKKAAQVPANNAFVMQPEVEPAPVSEPAPAASAGDNRWVIWLAVLGVSLCMRLVSTGGCNNSRPNAPNYRIPNYNLPPRYEPKFNDEDVKKGLDIMRQLREKYPHLRDPRDPEAPKLFPQPIPKVGPDLPPGYQPPKSPALLPGRDDLRLPSNVLEDDP